LFFLTLIFVNPFLYTLPFKSFGSVKMYLTEVVIASKVIGMVSVKFYFCEGYMLP